jgi:hypothetical protein
MDPDLGRALRRNNLEPMRRNIGYCASEQENPAAYSSGGSAAGSQRVRFQNCRVETASAEIRVAHGSAARMAYFLLTSRKLFNAI